MKNLKLGSILILLLVFTYFFIEKDDQRKFERAKSQTQITNFKKYGSIKSIKAKNFHITKKGKNFVNREGIILDEDKVNYLLNELLQLKVQRKIDVKDETLFSSEEGLFLEFSFEKGLVTFNLGNRIKINDHFYMKIIEDTSSYWVEVKKEGTFSLTEGRTQNSAPYLNFRELLSAEGRSFVNLRPFNSVEEIDDIKFNSIRNPEYEIEIDRRIITPLQKGLPISKDKIREFPKELGELNAFSVRLVKEKLSEEIGKLSINDHQEFKYYRKYGDKSGYFLEFENLVFEISSEFFRRSLVPVQYFLNKSIDGGAIVKHSDIFKDKIDQLDKILRSEAYMVSIFDESKLDKAGLTKIKFEKTNGYLEILSSEMVYYDKRRGIAFHFLEKLE